jgi:predicted glycosyltransferase
VLDSLVKVLIGIHTPFQVNFFEGLIARAGEDNEFLFAARDRDATIEMLEAKRLPYVDVGGYSGSDLGEKLREYAQGVSQIGDIIDEFRPDLILTERYPSAARAACIREIPYWTVFNDEREFHVNHLTHPAASKVFVPSFYQDLDLTQHGVFHRDRIEWFNGFITCYLKDYSPPEEDPFLQVEGHDEDLPTILIRPEFEFSVFFEGYKPVLPKITAELVKDLEVNVVVFPRTQDQRERYEKTGALLMRKPFRETPVAFADLVMGSAESMLCEAFTLGTPALSSIYWSFTMPMKVLHRYIPHSVEPDESVEIAENLLFDEPTRREYRSTSRKVIGSMENPIDVIAGHLTRS